MFTPPPGLAEDVLVTALAEHWHLGATGLTYEPVGFGAHHWAARDATRGRWFLTVHDLVAKRRDDREPTDEVFGRLTASFSAATALAEAGLTFVLAPVPAADGRVVVRLDDRYSLAVHPHLDGHPAGADGEYASDRDRQAVLALVVEVHRHTDVAAREAERDDLTVPHLHEIPDAIDALDAVWDTGPYGEPARALLDAHANGLTRLLAAYEELVAEVEPLFERAVLTHGEPHASNVLVVDHRFLLIDWDTAVLAPAERDLWDLDPGDGSILEAYRATTGLTATKAALDLYRLWYDLAEIGGYLGELRASHTHTADMAESWKNLQHYLRPGERWPDLVR